MSGNNPLNILRRKDKSKKQSQTRATVPRTNSSRSTRSGGLRLPRLRLLGDRKTMSQSGSRAPVVSESVQKKPFILKGLLSKKSPAKTTPERKNNIFDKRPARQSIVAINVPWVSQFDGRVPGAGDKACYRACRYMAGQIGVQTPASTNSRIQIATSETGSGAVIENSEKLKQAFAYINQELDQGRPVIAGTSHTGGKGINIDRITDHYVLITGRAGKTYTYHDPSTKSFSKGANKAFSLESSGNLVTSGTSGARYVIDKRQELAMVVPNSGTRKS